ncbi:MAG: hypothetical protein P8Y23_05195 [Candidatus Lokiarchaeota archaeon]
MTTWISTVGWSPFAVINPLWAYCKEYEDIPDKVILIYTADKIIKSNLDICKRNILEILKVYKGDIFNEKQIITEKIENDKLEVYADKLSDVLKNEENLNTNKVLLDMTPGRKYMSVLNVYYGFNQTTLPIRVFYLHLEKSEYQNVPYPLIPIVKSELIDILESTEVFTKGSEKILIEFGQLTEKILQVYQTYNEDEKKEYIILTSLSHGFNTKTQIKKFALNYHLSLHSHEVDRLLTALIKKQYILINSEIINNHQFYRYELTDSGKNELRKINDIQEGD